MKTFEVVMIGNTSVGKTCMLSALSTELDSYNLASKITIKATSEEFRTLSEKWLEMIDRATSAGPFTKLVETIQGNLVDFHMHEFDFKVDGRKKASVVFTDTRGAMTGTLDDELIERVNNAFGVFCVVDASVLMECTDAVNLRYNCPRFVRELLERVYTDGDGKQPSFVAFILTKCETYMGKEQQRSALASKFLKVYEETLKMLRAVAPSPRVYLLAVQTMMCARFLKLSPQLYQGQQMMLPDFRIIPNQGLKTKDCAYPLVILLKELIAATKHNSFLDWLLSKLGIRPSDLTGYLAEVDRHVRTPIFYKKLV